jgi:hypothetical protein
MDRQEAHAVAEARLERLRALPYDELLARYSTDAGNDPEWETAIGVSGTTYNLKLYAFWDASPGPDLRVWVDADDGSREAFHRPATTCFIIAPDGSFIGE